MTITTKNKSSSLIYYKFKANNITFYLENLILKYKAQLVENDKISYI